MYPPEPHDEVTSLARYVDQQLDAIRAAVLGLTDDEATSTPCRSTLSLVGIVKHVTHGMRGAVAVIADRERRAALDESAYADYLAAFSLADGETVAEVLAEFDAARTAYLGAIAAADPDADFLAPPAPWHGVHEPRPARLRYYLLHQVEEMARHAGHADIIREQVDGQSVPSLVMTLEGAPANQFFRPFVPRPGTIGAAAGD